MSEGSLDPVALAARGGTIARPRRPAPTARARPSGPNLARLCATHGAAALVALSACTGDASLGRQALVRAKMLDAATTDAQTAPMPALAGNASPVAARDASAATTATTTATPLELTFRSGAVPVTEISVQCPDACASVELAAQGGSPPYVLSWDDGSTQTQRTICPQVDQTLTANARDATGAQQSATLQVHRIECTIGRLCANNTSFEGAATLGTAWLTNTKLSATPWQDCRDENPDARSQLPEVVNAASGDEFPMASDGETYLYLESNATVQGYSGQQLCAPLERGSAYSFKLDLAYAAETRTGVPLDPGRLEIYASANPCTREQLLWTSPPLYTAWRTYCVTLMPHQDAAALVLSPSSTADSHSVVFVDRITAVDACP